MADCQRVVGPCVLSLSFGGGFLSRPGGADTKAFEEGNRGSGSAPKVGALEMRRVFRIKRTPTALRATGENIDQEEEHCGEKVSFVDDANLKMPEESCLWARCR